MVQIKSFPICQTKTIQKKKHRVCLSKYLDPSTIQTPKANSSSEKKSFSSSDLSKINFWNCTFISDPCFDTDVEEELFNLNDIAEHYHVDVSMFKRSDSNRAAAMVIRTIIKSKLYAVKQEQGYIFNGINADELIDFYISMHNRVEVAIVYKSKSLLSIFEVHSSPNMKTYL